MLAVKSVMAQKEEIETLIFDEIDTGISGRTAQKVAKTSVRNGKRKSGYLYQSSGSDRFNGRYAFFN